MIAQDVLLGRLPAVALKASPEAAIQRGGAARLVLKVTLVSVIAFEAQTPDPLMDLGTYIHRGIGSWTGLPIIFSPLELLVVVGLLLALASAATERRSGAASSLGWPVALFLIALVAGFARGVLGGGDMYVGLWEGRYLLYIPACFAIARISLRSAQHVASLFGTGLVAATAFAVEGAYRKFGLINPGLLLSSPDLFYEHDDVIFLATFLIFALSAFIFRTAGRIRLLSMVAAPVLMFTLLASNRRSGIIVLLVGLLVTALTLLVVRRKAFFIGMIPALVAIVAYLGVFWDASGTLGQPARALRSLYEPDARDASSNLYRLLETYNINVTIHSDPILGVGFGREFIVEATLPDLSWWPFWRFETHNNVLWMWMKTGVYGYVAFWALLGTAMSRAAYSAKRVADPRLKSAALFSLVALVGILVYGYVDLAFVSGRITVLLGTVLGVIAVLPRADAKRVVGEPSA
ncbi:MAG TPA: O-antigen ligase family protein [Candidatus Limnocylindria bacterium]